MTFAQIWDVSGWRGDVLAPAQALQGPALQGQALQGQALQDPAWPGSAVPASAGRRCQIALAPGPESARQARGFTTATLLQWALGDLVDEAVIIASELVTNAITHGTLPGARDGELASLPGAGGCGADGARGCAGSAPIELAWLWHASKVICAVTDRSPLAPVLTGSDLDAESGRGLQVVQAIAVAWGWLAAATGGKCVWAALSAPQGC